MITSVSDVQNTIPFVSITNESKPSAGVVAQWIQDTESMLSTALVSNGYVWPFQALPGKSTDAAIAVFKTMVRNSVAAQVLRARPNPESDPALLQARYDAIMKMIRDPNDPYQLPDIVITGEAIVKEHTGRVLSNLTDALDFPARISRETLF